MQHPPHEHDTNTHTEAPVSANAPASGNSFLSEIIYFAVIAGLIVLPIRFFIAQPFIVSGASMEETFENGEYLIIDQLSYRFEEPQHGDVVVFKYPKDPSKYFIKRIIGKPGDTVHINGSTVTIIDQSGTEMVLTEPYVAHMNGDNTMQVTLNQDEYFVMGDNRNASSDSRAWGAISRDEIIGRVFLRLLPATEAGVFPGKYDIDAQITQ